MLPVCASHGAKVIRIRANWIASRYWRWAFASSSLFDETITETIHEKEIISLRINYDCETGDVGNGVITETFSFSFRALSTRKSAAFHSSPVAKSLKHNFPFSSPTSPWQHGRDDSSLSNGCQPSPLARFSLGGIADGINYASTFGGGGKLSLEKDAISTTKRDWGLWRPLWVCEKRISIYEE